MAAGGGGLHGRAIPVEDRQGIGQAVERFYTEALLQSAPGLLTGAVAALFFRQSNTTRKHAADLLASTESDRRAETAKQILSEIKHDHRREEITAQLVMHLTGAVPAARAPAPSRSAGSGSARSTGRRSSSARAPA